DGAQRFLTQVLLLTVQENGERIRALRQSAEKLLETQLGHSVRGGSAAGLPAKSTWRGGCRLVRAVPAQAGIAAECGGGGCDRTTGEPRAAPLRAADLRGKAYAALPNPAARRPQPVPSPRWGRADRASGSTPPHQSGKPGGGQIPPKRLTYRAAPTSSPRPGDDRSDAEVEAGSQKTARSKAERVAHRRRPRPPDRSAHTPDNPRGAPRSPHRASHRRDRPDSPNTPAGSRRS